MEPRFGRLVPWGQRHVQSAVVRIILGLTVAALLQPTGGLTGGQRLGGGGHPIVQPNPVIDPPDLD
jgi:hypothetical protein